MGGRLPQVIRLLLLSCEFAPRVVPRQVDESLDPQVAKPNGPVVTSGNEPAPIWANRHGSDAARMAAKQHRCLSWISGVQVPKPGCSIEACRGEPITVRAECR